jgi:hypothetical protein
MNKLIAYLVSKIGSAYHSARFLLSILKLEFPHVRPHRATGQYFRDGVHTGDHAPTTPRSKKSSSRLFAATGVQEGLDNQAETSSDILGFWTGDPLNRFLHTVNRKSGGTQGDRGKDLQDVAEVKHTAQGSGEWDLLKPQQRQAIILDLMRECQAQVKDGVYHIFTTHDIVMLCDRPDTHWEIVFEDLLQLNREEKILITTFCNTKGELCVPCWGLK